MNYYRVIYYSPYYSHQRRVFGIFYCADNETRTDIIYVTINNSTSDIDTLQHARYNILICCFIGCNN